MRLFVYLMLRILAIGCDNETGVKSNACTASQLIEEVPWGTDLKKSFTNCFCETSIIKGTYNSQTVFFVALTDPLCNGICTPTLYNCEGKEIRTFTNSTADQKELLEEVTKDSVLYRCKS